MTGCTTVPRARFLLLAVGLLFMQACTPTVSRNPEAEAALKKFLLDTEPTGAIAIVEAKKLTPEAEVVLVGKVGAQEPGKAMFMVNEALPGAVGHTHKDGKDESDCPFCKRSKSDRIAMIQLLDDANQVLAFDSKALGLKEGQQLVVKGHGQVDSLDMYVVTATGFYVKESPANH